MWPRLQVESFKGSALGPILLIIYFNDLTDNLTIGRLLYADDVKLTPPPPDVPQGSLVASSKWSEDWQLILNPFQK